MFRYNDKEFYYCDSPYNSSRLNERAVEIPIAQYFYEEYEPDILEIGCVLPHYLLNPPQHTIVDKHETFAGVINEDIRTWDSDEMFSAAISISTIEHVDHRWEQIVIAIDAILARIKSGGAFLITMPYGFNRAVDNNILNLQFSHDALITRLDKVDFQFHKWKQVQGNKAPLGYNAKSRWANTVYVVRIEVE